MAKFAMITTSDGDKLTVNLDYVVQIRPNPDDKTLSEFVMEDQSVITIKEPYETVALAVATETKENK